MRPPNHNTNHRALVVQLQVGKKGSLKRYRKRIETLPMEMPAIGPRTEGEAEFEELQGKVETPPRREWPVYNWIRPGTWALIDQHAAIRRAGKLTRRMGRRAGHKIKASLKLDRIKRARKFGERIMEHLVAGDAKETWHSLQGWYRVAGEQQSKRYHDAMEK